MKILDFLCPEAISIDLSGQKKEEVIRELVELLHKAKKIKDANSIVKILLEREELGSTGIGQGIAIPHGKSEAVKDIVAAFGISKKGVNYNALDGEPVNLIFLLIAPHDSAGLHLKALAKISRLVKDKFFRQALREAKDAKEVIKIIKEEDEF
jgi:nitrogen PTS system EIIA component